MESREHNDRGVNLLLQGDLDGARAEYQAALEADPGNATACLDLSSRQAEGLREHIAAELQDRLARGAEGTTSGEVRIGGSLAGDVADRIAGVLRRQG